MAGRVLHLCLPDPMRGDAAAGRVNIINRIAAAIAPQGWQLAFHADTPEDRLRAAAAGHVLYHMQEPDGPQSLCLRRAYYYPFWRIEATNQRWNFDVARARFDPAAVDPAMAQGFLRRWRKTLLGEGPVTRDGFIFMPLQGRLTDHRSFQSMSPLAMIGATLATDPRPIRATLHPNEVYSAADHAALRDLSARNPRFSVVTGRAEDLLRACDLVVTQNSSVALTGFFAQKPAVVFAGIDFHHIAGSVPRDGLAGAFARAAGDAPDHAAYLAWFLKLQAINGGAPEAEAQILARFRAHSWPL